MNSKITTQQLAADMKEANARIAKYGQLSINAKRDGNYTDMAYYDKLVAGAQSDADLTSRLMARITAA